MKHLQQIVRYVEELTGAEWRIEVYVESYKLYCYDDTSAWYQYEIREINVKMLIDSEMEMMGVNVLYKNTRQLIEGIIWND